MNFDTGDNSTISFNDNVKNNRYNKNRKTSLPVIQGVNQKSLSLLIEEPTGMISARNRKLSQSNTPLMNQSGMISPGY